MSIRRLHKLLRLWLLLAFLSACTGLPPVYEGEGAETYKVRSGDTLYSIAFRYGLDYKSLATINRIGPPYTIYPNQVLKLRGTARQPEKDSGPVAVSRSTPGKARSVNLPASVSTWRWPLAGRVARGFSLSQPVNKGIDIAGSAGDPVSAAADGVVVYAGGNLRGYGKLVIIKHTDNFLSAYGNNNALLVKEGEAVKAGKTIARVGVSSSNEELLHFEIRRDGKPEDPLNYLPKKVR